MIKRLAIIGNGMATTRLLDELVTRKATARYAITVYGEERQGGYNRILLGQVLAGRSPSDIETKPATWYLKHGVRFAPGVRVDRLLVDEHTLVTCEGQREPYDMAIVATGSAAVLPALPGTERALGGVHVFRNVEDCLRIREEAERGRRAVVVGGGLLGLEAAKALVDLGLEVAVVHRCEVLMNAQLDATAGDLLRGEIQRLGIEVLVGGAAALEGDDRVSALLLTDGRRVPTDLVVFAVGVRPRIELARASGIDVGRGILVDDRLATSAPDVFALGECAEHAGTTYGLVAPCWDQAEVMADVLAGGAARYRGSRVHTRLKVAGLEVASMGLIEATHADDEIVQVVEKRRGVYRKLVVRDGKLAGAIVIGDPDGAAAAVRAFDQQAPLPACPIDFFCSGAGYERGPTTGREICNCRHVDETTISNAIAAGCETVQAIGERTGAGTGCGSCHVLLTRLLERTRDSAAA